EMIQQCMSIDPDTRPTAGKIMEWGHFYLKNNYWNKSKVHEKVFILRKMKTLMPVCILISLVSILVLFFLSYYKQDTNNAHVNNKKTLMPAEYRHVAGSQPIKIIEDSKNDKVVYTIQNKKSQIHPSKKNTSKEVNHNSYNVEEYF